jgi:hypothetical protein
VACGRATTPFKSTKQSVKPDYTGFEQFIEDQEMAFPPRGFAAEMTSLQYQAGLRQQGPCPDIDLVTDAMLVIANEVSTALQHTTVLRKIPLAVEELDWEQARLDCVDVYDHSPGLPYANLNNSIEFWLRDQWEWTRATAQARVTALLALSVTDILSLSPTERIARGLMDFSRVFVKGEPHAAAKMETGRYRLIFAVGIVDQLIDRAVNSWWTKRSIAGWANNPLAPGLGFTPDMCQTLIAYFKRMGDLAAVDASGWDWSVPAWLQVLGRIVPLSLSGWSEFLADLTIRIEILRSDPVMVLSGGSAFTFTRPGVMLSGRYETSLLNSIMQACMMKCATSLGSMVRANGDDGVVSVRATDTFASVNAWYSKCGVRLKDLNRLDGAVDFCSHLFYLETGKVEFQNFQKSLVRILAKPADKRDWEAFVREMRLSPVLPRFLSVYGLHGMAGVREN